MNSQQIRLSQVAHSRSGDKGNHSNIGVVAYTPAGYQWLLEQLTIERVAQHFHSLKPTRVERYELPLIGALNFMLYDVLGGGASLSLRLDTQGKLLGTAMGELLLPQPAHLVEMLRKEPA